MPRQTRRRPAPVRPISARNDENLLEITGSPELAQTSLAEFMRLYEHYRARAIWNMPQGAGSGADGAGRQRQKAFTFKMKRDHWVKGAFKEGTPEAIARVALACPPDRWNRAAIRDRPGVAARPGCS